ncbi:hypothetical protein ABZ707_09460 [Streptomyces sp. NPDC006923]|uniref:hypothetical protein n=1 Tax=Streptomyces sp. NPDC006923 TaxID=3155355 RepID=UPI0033D412B9
MAGLSNQSPRSRLQNPRAFAGTRDPHIPVAYVQTPVTAKPKSTCKATLDFYADHKGLDLPGLPGAVRRHVHAHGTVKMRASACSPDPAPRLAEEIRGELSLSPADRNDLAVCRLAQTMHGGSLGDAAYFLGRPTYISRGYRFAQHGALVLRAAKGKGLGWLDKTLLNIPDRLHEIGLIDYRRRRETLQDWLIPKLILTTMTSKILSQKRRFSPAKHELFTPEAERILDSVAIWTFVTHGRKTLAPQMKKYTSEKTATPTSHLEHLTRDEHGHHDLLQAYSEDLAHQIDQGPRPSMTEHFTWRVDGAESFSRQAVVAGDT